MGGRGWLWLTEQNTHEANNTRVFGQRHQYKEAEKSFWWSGRYRVVSGFFGSGESCWLTTTETDGRASLAAVCRHRSAQREAEGDNREPLAIRIGRGAEGRGAAAFAPSGRRDRGWRRNA